MNASLVDEQIRYWDRGERAVPDVTGAAHLLDCRDIISVLRGFRLEPPLKDALDVGCGTGRASSICDGYTGVDVSPSAIRYCQARGINARLIEGPENINSATPRFILCLSVFTHMDRMARKTYLKAFYQSGAKYVLADIIKGDDTGDIALWTANQECFERDVRACGFSFLPPREWKWDMYTHTYYLLTRNETAEAAS